MRNIPEEHAAEDAANQPQWHPQTQLTFLANSDGTQVAVETRFPQGVADMDDKNPLHVLAWYISANISDLLPTAITAWARKRTEMLMADKDALALAANDDAPDPALVQPAAPRLLGADGKPVDLQDD